jgi:hypothetical protein
LVLLVTPTWLSAQRVSHREPSASLAPVSGYDFTMTVTQTALRNGTAVPSEPPFVARVRTLGPVTRVDFRSGAHGRHPDGDWYLTRDLGRTRTLVNETAKRYRVMTTYGLREELAREKGLDVTVSGLEMSVAQDTSCRRIDGWETTCVIFHRRYRARTRYWLISQTTDVDETTRVWLAPALRDLNTPFGEFVGSGLELLVRRDSVYIARERDAGRALGAGGLVRMEVMHSETTGRSRTQLTRVIAISNVRRSPVVDVALEVPPGYRLVNP